ncbi:MAG TPA: hypothetical protein VIJ51_09095 [Solirubrobacteraceae bacterium]
MRRSRPYDLANDGFADATWRGRAGRACLTAGLAVVGWTLAFSVGGCLLASSDAWAGWSPAGRLVGSGSFLFNPVPVVAFDSRGVPWVEYSNESGLVVAALSSTDHLIDRQPVPDSQNAETALLSTNQAGAGVLAWSYGTTTPADLLGPAGVAAAPWRPGHAVGHRVVLAKPADNVLDAAAVNRRGTSEVLWTDTGAGAKSGLFAARLVSGRLAGAQRLGPTSEAGVGQVGLSPGTGGGFRASWRLGVSSPIPSAGAPGASMETALSTSAGVFAAPVSVPWPGSAGAGFLHTEQTVTNARGDQAIVWDQTGAPAGTVTVYASSRRAGRPFSPAQQVAQATWPTLADQHIAAVIGRTGLVTMMFTQPSEYPAVRSATGEIGALSGQAGARLGGSRLIASNEIPGREGPFLVLTPRGRAIAIWAATQRSGVGAIEAATSTNGAVFSIPKIISAATPTAPECELPGLLSAAGTDGALAGWTCTPIGGSGQQVNELARFR